MPCNPPSPFPSTPEGLVNHVKSKNASIYIGLPCYGCRMTTRTVTSLLRFQAFCIKNGIRVMFDIMGNESLITRGRSIMTERFVKSTATHLLFIDSDVSFNPISVMRMITYDGDVTAGIYAKKGLSWDNVATAATTTPEALLDASLNFNINLPRGEEQHTIRNGFVRVLDAATGFFCIKRETLETLKDALPEITVTNDIPGSRDVIKTYSVFLTPASTPTRTGTCRKTTISAGLCSNTRWMSTSTSPLWYRIREVFSTKAICPTAYRSSSIPHDSI